MANYESVLIARQDLGASQINTLVSDLSEVIKKEGGVTSREEFIYNCDAISTESTPKSIDVIIGRIRPKLGEDPKNPRFIHAIRGVGYKLEQ